jgi:hypothetical protein
MSKHATVNLQMVSLQGKEYNWKRPNCPNGHPKMWGHGYVARNFEGFPSKIFIKRYRCPTCRAVLILTPTDYYKHYQSTIQDIYDAISIRLKSYRWPPWTTRQRAGHWQKKFLKLVQMDFSLEDNLIEILERLYSKNICFLG